MRETPSRLPAASDLTMKLLLIDDDPELVAVLTLALERAGFVVWSAHDAPTALALLDAEPPDLVVLNTPLHAAHAIGPAPPRPSAQPGGRHHPHRPRHRG